MAEVINLRLARKTKDRLTKAREAEENRARHGQTKAERARSRSEAQRTARLVDGARREPEAD